MTAVEALLPEVVAIRHDLHAHPELMYAEHRTSSVVRRELEQAGVAYRAGLAKGTGVLGFLPATTREPETAPTIALRADMDALPIREATGRPYASQSDGKMHACGHDGHTAILLGTAKALARQERPNNVLLLFQPAEEGGAGGREMVRDGALNGAVFPHPAKMIFGLHGWTSVRLGTVATRVGAMMAATDSFSITIRGTGGHAAMPHTTVDPVLIAAHIVLALQSVASRNVDPFDPIVLSVTQLRAGTADNIIAETATLGGTMRTMSPETRVYGERRIREIAEGVAASLGGSAALAWHEGYPVTINHPGATAKFLEIARAAIGPDRVDENGAAVMGGEDFSFYGYEIPACFFQLGLVPEGQDSVPSVHTPYFDFNDEAIATGMTLFVALATADY
ncbi:MAG: amidohydrolase [Fimbriimonadaceae bacterium]|nr:amidohydrolase [Fimbriimonadaceae bacterium]